MKSNQILLDQQRLNRWHMWTTAAIYEKAVHQGFIDESASLRLVGAGWRHPAGLGTIQADLNASALIKNWAIGAVFREAIGREIRVTLKGAIRICATRN